MKISILGTGIVGQTIASKLSSNGFEVFIGTRNAAESKSRTKANPMSGVSFADWCVDNPKIQVMDYQSLPGDSAMFINATNGSGSIEALKSVGVAKLKGKIILDISNPLDFSKGFPPSLFVCNTDSLGEQIQREFPESRVVKGLNTMNCFLMVNPSLLPGDHHVFLSGNDPSAKDEVKSLLNSFGWKNGNMIDLGDISTARGTEMILPVWLRLYGALGTAEFNFHIVKK